MTKLEMCAVDSVEFHGGEEPEVFAGALQVSARAKPAPPGKPKAAGVFIDVWNDCGRWRVALSAEQLSWLRTALAKHAPPVEAVQ